MFVAVILIFANCLCGCALSAIVETQQLGHSRRIRQAPNRSDDTQPNAREMNTAVDLPVKYEEMLDSISHNVLYLVNVFREIVSPEVNLALGRPATQSSTFQNYGVLLEASRAVDGNYSNAIATGPSSCSHTNDGAGGSNWWRVQLDRPYHVQKVIVTNRDDIYADRLDYFIVGVTNSTADPVRGTYPLCGQYPSKAPAGATLTLDCDPNIGAGQYVIIQQPINGTGYLTLCEVEVYAITVENYFRSQSEKLDNIQENLMIQSQKLGSIEKQLLGKVCPYGFDYMPEIDQCLYLNLELRTWDDARTACARMKTGAQMVSIKDSAKQEAVRRYLQVQFTKQESSVCVWPQWTYGGKLTWTVGQTKIPTQCGSPYFWKPVGAAEIPFNYTNWAPGIPNCGGGDQTCAIIVSAPQYDYQWEDNPCEALLCSVCEF